MKRIINALAVAALALFAAVMATPVFAASSDSEKEIASVFESLCGNAEKKVGIHVKPASPAPGKAYSSASISYLSYEFASGMWIFREIETSDTGAKRVSGAWKNVPLVSVSGEKTFKDIYIDDASVRGYSGEALDRARLEYLLSLDGISFDGASLKQAAASAASADSDRVAVRQLPAQAYSQDSIPEPVMKLIMEKLDPVVYTGLIIDATETGAKRTLSPNIVTSDGKILHGFDKEMNTYKDIDGKDVIRYARSVDEAKEQKANIGTEPLVIKAVGATGHFKGDILISDEDAKAILEAEKHGKFLSNRKVIIAL
ncbi:MAG TPA: hypothetical protein PKH33_01110 [bacterium]|nr:hypothetical protein [bacterium]